MTEEEWKAKWASPMDFNLRRDQFWSIYTAEVFRATGFLVDNKVFFKFKSEAQKFAKGRRALSQLWTPSETRTATSTQASSTCPSTNPKKCLLSDGRCKMEFLEEARQKILDKLLPEERRLLGFHNQ